MPRHKILTASLFIGLWGLLLISAAASHAPRNDGVVSLGVGWNFVSLPLRPSSSYTAESVCGEINAQSGSVTRIVRWHNGGWDPHVCGIPFNDFPIELGWGYLVRSDQAGDWVVDGQPITSGSSLDIDVGWNAIGLAPSSAYTAERFCADISSQGGSLEQVVRWHNGGWDPHVCNVPFNDFPLALGEGYFVKSETALDVTIPLPAATATRTPVSPPTLIPTPSHTATDVPPPTPTHTPTSEPINNPPDTPSDPSPSDGATDQPLDILLTWAGGDPDGDAVTYDVYLEANDSTPDVRVSHNQAGTTYNPGTLEAGTHYYWKIVAKDSHGTTTTGPVWDFLIRSGADAGIYFTDAWPQPGSIYKLENEQVSTYHTRSIGRIYYLALAPNGGLYFSNANDFYLYRLEDRTEVLIYTHDTYLRDVEFDSQGRLYFSEATGAGSDGFIYRMEGAKAILFYRVELSQVDGSWAGTFAFDNNEASFQAPQIGAEFG